EAARLAVAVVVHRAVLRLGAVVVGQLKHALQAGDPGLALAFVAGNVRRVDDGEEVERELRFGEVVVPHQAEAQHAGIEVERRPRILDPQHGVVEHEAGGGGVARGDAGNVGQGGDGMAHGRHPCGEGGHYRWRIAAVAAPMRAKRSAGKTQSSQASVAMRPLRPSRRWEKKRRSEIVHRPPPWMSALDRPAASKRRRARAYRSTCQCPGRVEANAAAAPASSATNASRTSAPTSYAAGPAAGPSQATSSPAAARIAATVCSSTPAARPRQPACATATSLPSRAANTTGRQSAVRMASTAPGTSVTAASASGSAAMRPRSLVALP